MKKSFLIVLSVGLLFLSSCGANLTTSAVLNDSTNTSVDVSSDLTSVETSIESSSNVVEDEFTSIANLRSEEVGTEVQVKGVVLKHVYTGQGTPYITGFYLIDETGSVYIYGEDLAKTLDVNQEISLKGEIAYYIPESDSGAAESAGYKGALQLTNPTLIENILDGASIPTASINSDWDINDIQNNELTNDITGNAYELQGKVIVSEQPGYTNYYLQSLDLSTTLPFYTQSNGKDYKWLDEYSDQYVDMYVVVMNVKPSRNEWRALPVKVLSLYIPTADDYCHYGNLRMIDTYFADRYTEDITISIPKEDPQVFGLTYSFGASGNGSDVSISTTDTDFVVKITIPSEETSFELIVTSNYEETTLTDSYTITLAPKPALSTMALSEIRKQADGTEVTAEGIVTRITYKSGNKRLGFIIQDATGSMIIYNNSDTMANLDNIEEGNKVVVKGTFGHYIKDDDAEKAAALNYKGDTQISDVEILNNDNKINDMFDSSIIKDKSVSDIVSIEPSTDPVGNIYQCAAVIEKTSTAYYTAYRISDPDDSSKSLSLYSQMQGSEFEFLDENDSEEVILNFAIQNIKYSSGSFAWRICAISVVD